MSAGLLGYTLWHWKQPTVSEQEYEANHRAFHAELLATPSLGYHRSCAAAVSGLSWANAGGDAYQDRYILEGSAALDPLDSAVAHGARQRAHDRVAFAAGGGIAGLYRVKVGTPLSAPRFAYWFAKPAGLTYPTFLDAVTPLLPPDRTTLWMRALVLGPTPEFCIESSEAVAVPPEWGALEVPLRPVWP